MDEQEKSIRFRQWVEEHYAYGLRLADRILGDKEEARDLVQDAFVKVWENMEQYREGSRFTTWLYRILVNLCYDNLRKRKHRQRYSEEASRNEPSGLSDPTLNHETRDMKEWVIRLSWQLGEKQRVIMVLRDIEDMEMQEIIEITGLSPDQVKANLYHARKTMRGLLEKLNLKEGKS